MDRSLAETIGLPTSHSQAPESVRGGTGGDEERWNGHLTLLYETRAGQMNAVASFFRRGLSEDERCLYIGSQNGTEAIREALRDRGIAVEDAVDSGDLGIREAEDVYLEDGTFDPDRVLEVWENEREAAAEHAGLRVAGEMSWIRDAGVDRERLMRYETAVDGIIDDTDMTAMCQYDRTMATEDLLGDLLQTHPVVVADESASLNPHYRSPDDVSTGTRPSIDPARAIDRLTESPAVEPQSDEQRAETPSNGTHVHLCLANDANRRRLADYLEDQYESVTIADVPNDLEERDIDLCILDAEALDRYREMVIEQKKAVESPLLPFLVVTRESTVPEDPTIRKYVDELVAMPTERETLEWRIETLLRMRSLSAQLAAKNERLEHLAEAAAHDLRNPLAVAQGYLQRVNEGEERDTIAAALDRMESLIEKVLAIANTSEPTEKRNVQSVDLASIVEKSWDVVPTGEAALDNSIDADRTVRAEPALLRQLLENLFRNAVEHAGDDVHVQVGTIDDRGFYVADDGPGIPADEREAVFVDDYSTASGSGLGLAVVKRVARYHDWAVYLTESEAGGARFEIVRSRRSDESR